MQGFIGFKGILGVRRGVDEIILKKSAWHSKLLPAPSFAFSSNFGSYMQSSQT